MAQENYNRRIGPERITAAERRLPEKGLTDRKRSEVKMMRTMEFKMERQGLLEVGQEVDVTESPLPTSYYYTIQPMVAMSKNYQGYERLKSRKGLVKEIRETDRGYYAVVEFDEEE